MDCWKRLSAVNRTARLEQIQHVPSLQIEVEGLLAGGVSFAQAPRLRAGQLHAQRADQRAGQFLLHREHIGEPAFEGAGPDVVTIVGADQLGGDFEAIALPAHASFHHKGDVQFGGDLVGVGCLPLNEKAEVREGRRGGRRHWQSASVRSSASPSAKYSLAGSGLKLRNGRTAMEGVAGAAGVRNCTTPHHAQAASSPRPPRGAIA